METVLKCIVIDDEPLAIDLLSDYIGRINHLQLLQTFDDAIHGGEFLRHHQVDLLFVDINMPDITGIDLLRSLPDKPLTIFTTAYKKFAYEGFELDIIDYLLKPISFDRFQKAVQKAITYQQSLQQPGEQESFLFVRSEYRMLKIPLSSINYLEGLEDYVKIHIEGAKPVMTLMTMKAMLEKLPAQQFRRIHRSYIVPIQQVTSILNKKVMLQHGIELPISDSYVSFINDWMQGH
jgi:DNA-binding LytR/AlgR family response regulator